LTQQKKSKKITERQILEQITKSKVKWIRLQFCNPFGLLHQLSVPAKAITKESFVKGFSLDGSSVLGFTDINKSDILLVPDPNTFVILPDYFDTTNYDEKNQYLTKAARMFANVNNGFDGEPFTRDPRYLAKNVEEFSKKMGFSKTYWAAELEFFVFDKIMPNQKKNSLHIVSKEAPWISNNPDGKIHFKKGYYRDSPSDTLVNFRDEVCDVMQENFKIKTIAHHHEVATAGQSEIVLDYDGLVKMADSYVTGVKTIREVASKRGMVASFNPKPIPNDNGSAVHINQSLWKKKNGRDFNAFYDPTEKYAELSQIAYYYIGGLLHHAKALCAITNPTADSYRRLIPGFEAPTNIAWGKMNRSVSVRIPAHHKKMPTNKRIEYRPPDPTSNIYLVETAILLAGLDGIKKKIQPPDPVDLDTYKLSKYEMKKFNIKKLPTSLLEAISSLKSDDEFLTPIIGDDFLDMYLSVLETQI